MRRSHAAVLSLHTSPLAQPGSGDSGGMNVYVRELVAGLAHSGVDCSVYVRRWSSDLPREVEVEPGVRVVHIDAGAMDLQKDALYDIVDEFVDGVKADLVAHPADVVHANYWLSGVAGHRLKHELGIPLVSTFHTLARVKAATGDYEPQRRIDAEAEVIQCSDIVTASCQPERNQLIDLYNTPADRIRTVTPGVEHALFSPGNREGARRALELGSGPHVLFVGRIQPLKGVDVAVGAFAELDRDDATLLIVGGASGEKGDTEVQRIEQMVADLGINHQVHFIPPQPHHRLSTYYRASDIVLMPSRSESFGLVALEAAACGIPVVAAAVGGLRTLVDHGRTGFLVAGRDPQMYGAYLAEILDNPAVAVEMAMAAAAKGRRYSWSATARGLADVYAELADRVLVNC